MKNILITGGLGFIGSHFTKLLVNSGYNVIIIDKGTYASDIRRIEKIRDKVKLYMGDICDRELVEKIIKEDNIDIVVNFAAETHVDNAINNSEPFIHSNYIGVWNLLEIVRKNKEEGKNIRFIQIGTDESYGDIIEGSFREDALLRPSNPYSATKAAADLLALSYYRTYGLDICITRSCNNFGENQDSEKLIPRCITNGKNGYSLKIYGNGNNIRQWIYVKDNCLGIKVVMEGGRLGEIYNIGADCYMANNQIAQKIRERFNVPIDYVEDRKGHDKRYSIDYSKIRKELGWIPVTTFEEGFEKTINFYMSLGNEQI